MPRLWRDYEGACLNMDLSFFTDGRALLFMTIAGIVYYFYLLATDSNE
jgi:hypothetical protein